MKQLIIALCSLIPLFLQAQGHEDRQSQINVLAYQFEITVAEDTDEIQGTAMVEVEFLKPTMGLVLDLVKAADGKGMKVEAVDEVTDADKPLELRFQHVGEQLRIQLRSPVKAQTTKKFAISYHGIPADGLIISKNRHGNRTLFGDNWPNRAHHWLPCVDHPSDKATVTWIIHHPPGYKAVANGKPVRHSGQPDGSGTYTFEEKQLLPTKVMVFGMADFQVEEVGKVGDIVVQSWVFPEDTAKGFDHYDDALPILATFIDSIGPYAYSKLDNVQSKTRYGGMENANTIFYYESSVDKEIVPLLAHELAHQWFGNMATEANWHHIWLSEGFATYLTDLYLEWTLGPDELIRRMTLEREKIFRYQKQALRPVVDTQVEDLNQLLNPNSYEKGAWFLHMLRHQIGYQTFMKGVRTYYKEFAGRNAITENFKLVMERTSGQDLDWIFDQWLFEAGHPEIEYTYSYNKKKKAVELKLEQVQEDQTVFEVDIEVAVTVSGGETILEKVHLDGKKGTYEIKVPGSVKSLALDPGCKLLAEYRSAGK